MISWFFAALFLTFSCLALPVSADVKARVLRQPAATSTGNQDFTISGFGTPKGAIAILTYAVSNGVGADNAAWSVGLTDCTNSVLVHTQDRADGGTTSDTNRRATTTAFAELLESGTANGATLDGIGTVSCITDGIRINWTTAMSAGFLVHVVLFGGSDMQVKVDVFTQNATVDASVDITTVGFQPEGVFCLSAGLATANWDNSNQANSRIGFGVATTAGQGSVSQAINDAVTTTAYGGGTSSQYACNSSLPADFLEGPVELSGFDAQGFTATTRSETQTFQFGYLAYTTGGKAASWSGEMNAPATPQSQSYTGPGFRPQAYMLFITGAATINTEIVADDAGQFGLGMGDATAQFCASTRGDDGATTVENASLSVNTAVSVRNQVGTARWVASLTGFTSTGMDLDFTTSAAAAAWYGWFLAEFPRPRGGPLWLN